MEKNKIYTAEMAARALADQILKGQRYAERFHIEVPEGMERIDDYAFDNLFVMNIKLPSTLREIGDYAFRNTPFQNLVCPPELRSIGKGAFWCCEYIKNIRLNDNLEFIGEKAFYHCFSCGVVIPKSVKTIEVGAFYGAVDRENDGTYKIKLEAEPDFVFNKNVSDYFSYKDGKLEFHERPNDLMWKSVYC